MKQIKCLKCDYDLSFGIFKGTDPYIHFFTCSSNSGHYINLDFHSINDLLEIKSFYYVDIKSRHYLEIFYFHDKINYSFRDGSITSNSIALDDVILKNISNKFLNNELTEECVLNTINKLQDLMLFL